MNYDMNIKIAGITKNSVVDGPGLRYVIFTQGCYHNCEGCQNPQTHDSNKGTMYDTQDIIEEYMNENYDGLTLSGGEPFLQAEACADICFHIKTSDTNIICYTGYTWEKIMDIIKEGNYSYLKLLNNIDYLIDGPFDKSKASLDCLWRGSTNQRIIDVKSSLKENKPITVDEI